MFTTTRFTKPNSDFREIVAKLDKELALSDGKDHFFYNQFNGIEKLKNIVLGSVNNKIVACGAFKELNQEVVEIKRMFVLPSFRGQGFSTQTLKALEQWAQEKGFTKMVLETGKKQVEAVIIYPKYVFKIIPNYGQYVGVKNSICFGKTIQ